MSFFLKVEGRLLTFKTLVKLTRLQKPQNLQDLQAPSQGYISSKQLKLLWAIPYAGVTVLVIQVTKGHPPHEDNPSHTFLWTAMVNSSVHWIRLEWNLFLIHCQCPLYRERCLLTSLQQLAKLMSFGEIVVWHRQWMVRCATKADTL